MANNTVEEYWLIEKTGLATPLNEGIILNDATQLDEKNTLSVKKIIKSISNYKQLLINNDFQVNQRRKTSYQNDDYTIDMWYLRHPHMKCNILEKGIRLEILGENGENNYSSFNQNISDFNKYLGKTLTFAIKVNAIQGLWNVGLYFANVIYSSSLPLPSQDEILSINTTGVHTMTLTIPENFDYQEYTMLNFSVYTDKTDNGIKIGDYIEIEYVDLFEGNIAYQHKKEDYAITELKCMAYGLYLEANSSYSLVYGYYAYPYDTLYFKIYLPTIMLEGATILFDGLRVLANITNNYYTQNDFLILSKSIRNNTLTCAIRKKSGAFPIETDGGYAVSWEYLSISKEPL